MFQTVTYSRTVSAHVLIALCWAAIAASMPTVCREPCLRTQYGDFVERCEDMGLAMQGYCEICRNHGFCPELPAWARPVLQVGWNPFVAKTCDSFPPSVVTECDSDYRVGSICNLRCSEGYLPSPHLYKGFGGERTHDEIMSFKTTCSYSLDGSSVEWSSGNFSCTAKKDVMDKYYPDTIQMFGPPLMPPSPYPDSYIINMFGDELTAVSDDDSEQSGDEMVPDDRRTLGLFNFCGSACARVGRSYKYGCSDLGAYFCIVCRMRRLCATSRSFLG